VIELIIAIAGFYFFFAHSLTTQTPFVRFDIFKDRNYVAACFFMIILGMTLFGTMALVTPFMQNVMGYPVLTAGNLLSSRGAGTLIAMLTVTRLMRFVPPRYLVLAGLLLTAFTLWQMAGFTEETAPSTIVYCALLQGYGLGLLFIPLNTVAFATLPAHLRTDGTAILTLLRNLGSSVGISIMIANLTNTTTVMHERLMEHITPFNDALKMPDVRSAIDLTTDAGRALLDAIVTQQATIIAYANDFTLMMFLTLAATPFVFLLQSTSARKKKKEEPVAAMD
jgi:DHA2 family multidrug resistance protein